MSGNLVSLALEAVTTQDPGGSSGAIVALLGATGLGAILAAVVTGYFSRRKLGAEATQIITNAAAGVVTSMQAQLDRSDTARTTDQHEHEAEMARITHDHALAMTSMAEAHVAERHEWQKVLNLHAAWDHVAIEKLLEHGYTDLPPTPPLEPDVHYVDEHGYPIKGVD